MSKTRFRIFFAIIILYGCNFQETRSINKYDKIVTKQTEIKQIISEEVNDTFFVYIRLPKKYNEGNKRYPVLYLLDGDISFNMAVSIVRYLQYGREVPDLIIVAPGYGTLLSDDEINYRERDYTISQIDRFEGSGGAKNYIRFLRKELLPFIDSNYRTSKLKAINGYSLGGLFTINLLLEQPSLFSYYIAGSPYLTDDSFKLSKKIDSVSKFEAEKRLFISVGEFEDEERYYKPTNKIIQKLTGISELKLKFRIFDEGTHFSSPSQALAYGLKFSFE